MTKASDEFVRAPSEGVAASGNADRSLRACLASPLFHPEYSGGAARFRRYAPGLEARGIEMEVVATALGTWKPYRKFARGTGTAGHAAPLDIDSRVERVPLPDANERSQRSWMGRNYTRFRNRWIYESAMLARCKDPATRPDLVIWRYPLSMSSARVLRPLRRMGIPMMRVVTMYGGPGGRGWKRKLKEHAFPVPFGYLDCVVVSSTVMKENLQTLGVTTRIEVIPHGVDLQRFRPHPAGPAAAPVRRRLGLGEADQMLLFVGPVSQRKGVDLLAQAWGGVAAKHERAHLVIVGPERSGSDKGQGAAMPFADKVRDTVERGGGGDRITFVGPVADVDEYMRAADLFVFPSRREGMPNVVLEAFASGLPCVLGPFLGLSEDLGQPGEQYFLAEHDPEQLRAVISELLANDARRKELGRSSFAFARDHLDVERALDRLASLCRELVERARTGRS